MQSARNSMPICKCFRNRFCKSSNFSGTRFSMRAKPLLYPLPLLTRRRISASPSCRTKIGGLSTGFCICLAIWPRLWKNHDSLLAIEDAIYQCKLAKYSMVSLRRFRQLILISQLYSEANCSTSIVTNTAINALIVKAWPLCCCKAKIVRIDLGICGKGVIDNLFIMLRVDGQTYAKL